MIRWPTALLLLGSACADSTDLTSREWEILSELRWAEPNDDIPANTGVGEDHNALYDDPAAVELGQALYFDVGLSSDGTVSCNLCHDAPTAGTDLRPGATSAGVIGPGPRNAPTIYNTGQRDQYSWFGQEPVLWKQIVRPIVGPFHQGRSEAVATHVCETYTTRYTDLFGPCDPSDFDPADGPYTVLSNVAKALAAYSRTLESSDSDFDRYMGDTYEERDPTCLPEAAVRGAALFAGKASCMDCHNGPTLSNGEMYVLGLGTGPDAGQEYQTPPLRNVANTGPFMHDGSLPLLWDVLDFYSAGGNTRGTDARAVQIVPLDLTDQDLLDIEGFLESLTGAPLPYCQVVDPSCCDQGAALDPLPEGCPDPLPTLARRCP